MKRIYLLFTLTLFFLKVFSQMTGVAYLPEKSENMPSWMNLFYEGVTNASELENAYNQFYQHNAFDKNTYTQFYKRWMIEHQLYIQDDGTVPFTIEVELNENQNKFTSGASKSNWSLIGPVETYQASWNNSAQPKVPWQVNIYSFDVAISNQNIVYACPETGGIFKSADKGLNWVSVSDNYKLGAVTAIAIHPNNSNIVYASAGNNIYKTTDGGLIWNTIYTIAGLNCNDIAILPNNPAIVFFAGVNGLYKTINAGSSLSLVNSTDGVVYDIETNPLRDSTIYILRKATSDLMVRFYRSYDAGNTFSVINSGWGSGTSNAARMTITPADSNYIYAVLLMGGTINAPIIMRSTTAGDNWSHTCTGIQNSLTGNSSSPLGMSNGQGYYDLSIMASSTNKAQLIVGTTTAYKSLDTGNTFTPVGGYVGSFTIHPDIQEMKIVGNDSWIATDGGLNYSTDFFTNTTNLSSRINGIYGTNFWGYGQGWNEDLITGGRYHNGNTAMYDGYPSGSSLRLGGGEAGTGYGMVGRDMYVAHSDIGAYVLPKTFSGSKSNFTFTMYPNEDGYGWDASEFEFSPDCYNVLFVGKDSSLWKSIDGGISYTEVFNFHQRVKKFEICRSNPLVMYLATNINLYKTINGGFNWSVISRPSGVSMSYLSLSVSYTDENILWLTSKNNGSNNKVFTTTNGGLSWINLTTATINPYSFLVINHQAGTDGGVYISSRDLAKVFYRNNSMSDWVDLSSNLPKGYRPLSTKPFYKKSKLRTAGNRGVWELDFYETSSLIVQPTVDKLESFCIRDTFYFDDFSVVNHNQASWQWSFPGASYISDVNARNPKVLYATFGIHTATLTITQNSLSVSKSITVNILANSCGSDTIPGNALLISSNGNYANVPPLNLNSNTITISAWIKPNAVQNDWAGIVFCRGGTTTSGISLRSNLEFRFHWDAGNYGITTGLYVIPNEWNYVAFVMTPTAVTLYVNEKMVTKSGNFNPEMFDAATYIGNDKNSTSRTFKGLIDEVCFWNRALTTDEIRALRHLTKDPTGTDTTLVAYYQFNEASGQAFDKVGTRHASLTAGASRDISTAPFASGSSSKITINNGGLYNFVNTDLTMAFPTAGGSVYPNGDVWVSKLNALPNDNANQYPIENNYWVVNSYGTNSTFSPLDSIFFSGLPAMPNLNASNYLLYERSENAYGASWNIPIANADSYFLNGNNSKLVFEAGNSINSFGQFSLNSFSEQYIGMEEIINDTELKVTVYPNPVQNDLFVKLIMSKENQKSVIMLYDNLSQEIFSSRQNLKVGENIIRYNTSSLSSGIYLLKIEVDGLQRVEKIVVN